MQSTPTDISSYAEQTETRVGIEHPFRIHRYLHTSVWYGNVCRKWDNLLRVPAGTYVWALDLTVGMLDIWRAQTDIWTAPRDLYCLIRCCGDMDTREPPSPYSFRLLLHSHLQNRAATSGYFSLHIITSYNLLSVHTPSLAAVPPITPSLAVVAPEVGIDNGK